LANLHESLRWCNKWSGGWSGEPARWCRSTEYGQRPVGSVCLTRYSTDSWGASTRHRDTDAPQPGKCHTPQIERKHLTLRIRITRLVRKTLGFSRSIQRHDIGLGLCIHRYEFGMQVSPYGVQICNAIGWLIVATPYKKMTTALGLRSEQGARSRQPI
jgi:hypothetical protein